MTTKKNKNRVVEVTLEKKPKKLTPQQKNLIAIEELKKEVAIHFKEHDIFFKKCKKLLAKLEKQLPKDSTGIMENALKYFEDYVYSCANEYTVDDLFLEDDEL